MHADRVRLERRHQGSAPLQRQDLGERHARASTATCRPVGRRRHRRTRYGMSGSASPTFARPGDPKYATPLGMPKSNGALRNFADKFVAGQGCLYTGPTKITLRSTGRWTSSARRPIRPTSTPGAAPAPAAAGVNSTGLDLPANGVIYVQNKVGVDDEPVLHDQLQHDGPARADRERRREHRRRTSTTPAPRATPSSQGVLKGRLTIARREPGRRDRRPDVQQPADEPRDDGLPRPDREQLHRNVPPRPGVQLRDAAASTAARTSASRGTATAALTEPQDPRRDAGDRRTRSGCSTYDRAPRWAR